MEFWEQIGPFWEQLGPVFSNVWFKMVTLLLIATFHGYGAAWLAVRMLFRPRNPFKILGITVFPQGMIPRHRERLANAIGKAVGNELMSRETVLEELFEKEFLRNKISSVVDSYTRDILSQDYPTLIESLPEDLRQPVLDSVETLQVKIGAYVEQVIKSEDTFETIRSFVEERVDEVLAQTVSEAVDDETFEQLLKFLEGRVRSIAHEPELEKAISGFIGKRVDDLVNTQTPLRQMFTDDAIGLLKEKAFDQIQPIVHQLAELATEDRTKTQISSLIKKEVHNYYEQLPFFKKIFVSRDNLLKEVDDLVDDSLPKRIEETLQGDFFAEEARNFVGNAIDSALDRPVPDLLGKVEPDQLSRLKTQLTVNILGVLQGEEMQRSVSGYLTDSLESLRGRRISDLLRSAHPKASEELKKTLSKGLMNVLSRKETAEIVDSVLSKQIEVLLHSPIGRLSDHISEEKIKKAGETITSVIVEGAKAKLPEVIEEFDIGGVVRDKVNNYPAEKLEALIMTVAKEHLRTIELFGAVLGFLIGIGQSLQFYFSH